VASPGRAKSGLTSNLLRLGVIAAILRCDSVYCTCGSDLQAELIAIRPASPAASDHGPGWLTQGLPARETAGLPNSTLAEGRSDDGG
jgi:hypothetical protein